VLEKLIFFIVGAIVFFLWYQLFLSMFDRILNMFERKKRSETMDVVREIGRQIHKLDADFCLTSNDFTLSDDKSISREESRALMNLYIACLEYRIPYLYVAQKDDSRLILEAYSEDFKAATIELE
jgi:hypothetical protein